MLYYVFNKVVNTTDNKRHCKIIYLYKNTIICGAAPQLNANYAH